VLPKMQLDFVWLKLILYCSYVVGCTVRVYLVFIPGSLGPFNDHLFSSHICGNDQRVRDLNHAREVLCTRSSSGSWSQ